ncbi:MAG TPA: TlpA disulfide reductase family protein [Gemmatimonadaceae bacterium]|nr:TlpA disulfide reductase family protein [Gemmatimonadaceae bacterium]
MTAARQWAIVAVVIAALALGLAAMARSVDRIEQVTVGATAPEFRAWTLDEPPVERSLADYRGEVVLLNIWATWCVPCRVEMPSMEQLSREFGGRGFRVVAVSIDRPGLEHAIVDFVREYELTFDILYDPSQSIMTAYQATGVPYSFVIDRQGVIRRTVLGATDWHSEANRALIESMLGEGA